MPHIFDFELDRPAREPAHFKFTLIEQPNTELLQKALQFRSEIELTNLVIWDITSKTYQNNLYEIYVSQIEEVARLAFKSELNDILFAESLLEDVKISFVQRVGQRYRLWHIKRISIVCMAIAVPAFLYGAYFSGVVEKSLDISENMRMSSAIAKPIYAASWALFGVSISVWFAAVIRNRRLDWRTLTTFDPDGFSPFVRLALVGCATYILALLVNLEVLKIGFGSVNLADFLDRPKAAILLGIMGGLAGDAVNRRILGQMHAVVENKQSK